jgi:hypothetical protein
MSRYFAVLALVFVLAGIAAAAAMADPTGAMKSAPVTVVCGDTTYYAVANGSDGNGMGENWGPAHDVNSNTILHPLSFGVETDVFTPVAGPPVTTLSPPRTRGSSSPNGGTQLNCTYTVGPITIPGVGTFEAFGSVLGYTTHP